MVESDEPQGIPGILGRLADNLGGNIEEIGLLPDQSGFAVMSMPLPADHWSTQDDGSYEPPPMPFRMGRHEFVWIAIGQSPAIISAYTRKELAEVIQVAGRYAFRASTMKGKEPDLDPDALIQNLIVGLLGYWTDTGLSEDPWANPQQERT